MVQMTPLELKAVEVGGMFGLPPSLVCAICKVESGWDTWACRFEPGFKLKYVDKLNVQRYGAITVETEKVMRSCSWGLMQVMGQVAREMGCKEPFLSSLCSPEVGLAYGCRKLFALSLKYATLEEVISAYNAGSPTSANRAYVDKILLESKHYEELLHPARPARP